MAFLIQRTLYLIIPSSGPIQLHPKDIDYIRN
jgi:hypothetical protein